MSRRTLERTGDEGVGFSVETPEEDSWEDIHLLLIYWNR